MTAKEISEIFYNWAVGTAAIAGVGIWATGAQVVRLFNIWRFRKQYSIKSLGKTWRLIRVPNTPEIYAHDLELNLRRHVANPATMDDLHFDWRSVRPVSPEELEGIGLGSPINTEKKR
jgi:hypothetical protein